jgi:hypothetical protein
MDLNWISNYQTIIAALIATIIAWRFNASKIKLDKDIFCRELFLRYNDRYDEVNDGLEKLICSEFDIDTRAVSSNGDALDEIWKEFSEGEPAPKSEIISAAFDYINLCSEEYYWYKKGFIDQDVWKCWHKGMQDWHRDSFFIKKIIQSEKSKNAAYYNDDFLSLFHD